MTEAAPVSQQRPSLWPLLVFSTTVAFLMIPIAVGSTGVRLGAVGALGGMVAAFLFGVRRTRRVEHGEDATPPSFLESARESTAPIGRMFVYIAGYVLLIFLAFLADGTQRRESGVKGVLVATLAAALVVATLIDSARLQRRKDGVERQIFSQSTSLAFFITVLGAVSYALFEVFADAPKLSMWLVWTWGMAAWGIASSILAKRAT